MHHKRLAIDIQRLYNKIFFINNLDLLINR